MNRVKELRNSKSGQESNKSTYESDLDNLTLNLNEEQLSDNELLNILNVKNTRKKDASSNKMTKKKKKRLEQKNISTNKSVDLSSISLDLEESKLTDVTNLTIFKKSNSKSRNSNSQIKKSKMKNLSEKSTRDSLYDLELSMKSKNYDESFYVRPSPKKKAKIKSKKFPVNENNSHSYESLKETVISPLQQSLNRFREKVLPCIVSPNSSDITELNTRKSVAFNHESTKIIDQSYPKHFLLLGENNSNDENHPNIDKRDLINVTRRLDDQFLALKNDNIVPNNNHNSYQNNIDNTNNKTDYLDSFSPIENINNFTNVKLNQSDADLRNKSKRRLFSELFEIVEKPKSIKKKGDISNLTNITTYDLFDREDDVTFHLNSKDTTNHATNSEFSTSTAQYSDSFSNSTSSINKTVLTKSRLMKSLDITEDQLNEILIEDNESKNSSLRRSQRRKVQTLPSDQYQIIEYVRTKYGYEIKEVIKLDDPKSSKINKKKNTSNNKKLKRIYFQNEDISLLESKKIMQNLAPIKTIDKDGNKQKIDIFINNDEDYFCPYPDNSTFKMIKFIDNNVISTGSMKIFPDGSKGLQLSMLTVFMVVIKGVLIVEIDKIFRMIGSGASFTIPPGISYDLINKTKSEVIVYYAMIKAAITT